MTFAKGRSGNPHGRPRGVPNRFNGAFRERVQTVYDDIGGDQAFAQWARENPTEFYRICARLIPVQLGETSAPPVINFIMSGHAVDAPESRPALDAP